MGVYAVPDESRRLESKAPGGELHRLYSLPEEVRSIIKELANNAFES